MIKSNELSRHEKTRKNLKCILLCERSQSEKTAYYMIITTRHSGKGKTMEIIKSLMVAGGWG